MVKCKQRDASWWMMFSSTMHTRCSCYLLCVCVCVCVCVCMRTTTSTSIEHELTKRALESIILVSSSSNPTRIPLTCFASNMLKIFSCIWFLCKHVDDFCAICDNHAPMILNIDALCVATNMLYNFSFLCFVCNHIAILTWLITFVTTLSPLVLYPTSWQTALSFGLVACPLVIIMLPWPFFMNMICVAINMMKKSYLQWFILHTYWWWFIAHWPCICILFDIFVLC
jgi:hypothetical protein